MAWHYTHVYYHIRIFSRYKQPPWPNLSTTIYAPPRHRCRRCNVTGMTKLWKKNYEAISFRQLRSRDLLGYYLWARFQGMRICRGLFSIFVSILIILRVKTESRPLICQSLRYASRLPQNTRVFYIVQKIDLYQLQRAYFPSPSLTDFSYE